MNEMSIFLIKMIIVTVNTYCGPAWAPICPAWGPVGPALGPIGPVYGLIGPVWGTLSCLGSHWACLRSQWACWGPIGPALGPTGPVYGLIGPVWGPFGPAWGRILTQGDPFALIRRPLQWAFNRLSNASRRPPPPFS